MVNRRKLLSLTPALGVLALPNTNVSDKPVNFFETIEALHHNGYWVSVTLPEPSSDPSRVGYIVNIFDDAGWVRDGRPRGSGYSFIGSALVPEMALQQAIDKMNAAQA